MQLNIPVHQTITLPDAWQACKTPQELSYWLIAKLDSFEASVANAVTLAQNAQNTADSLGSRIQDVENTSQTATETANEALGRINDFRNIYKVDVTFTFRGPGQVTTGTVYMSYITDVNRVPTADTLFSELSSATPPITHPCAVNGFVAMTGTGAFPLVAIQLTPADTPNTFTFYYYESGGAITTVTVDGTRAGINITSAVSTVIGMVEGK